MQVSLTSLLPRQRGLQLPKTTAPLTLEAALNLLEVSVRGGPACCCCLYTSLTVSTLHSLYVRLLKTASTYARILCVNSKHSIMVCTLALLCQLFMQIASKCSNLHPLMHPVQTGVVACQLCAEVTQWLMQASLTVHLPGQRAPSKTAASLTQEAALNLPEVSPSCSCYQITLRKISTQLHIVYYTAHRG